MSHSTILFMPLFAQRTKTPTKFINAVEVESISALLLNVKSTDAN